MHTLLLQSNPADALLYLILLVIGLIIGAFITRWVFRINTIIGYLQHQSYELTIMRRVLSRMAQKKEVSEEEIKNLVELSKSEHYK
jgi:hypothetical protein